MQRPALADYPPGARLAERALDDYEFVWMVRGQATVTAAAPFSLRPGQLLLVPPGFRHGFVWDARRPTQHGYFHFAAGDVDRALPAEPCLRDMTPQDPLRGVCAYLLWLGSLDDAGWLPAARAAVDLLVALVADGPLPATEEPAVLPPALRAVVVRLRESWSVRPLPRIGVAELAATSGVSRGYLNRMFRAAFGLSVTEALERLRCGRAETLLVRTDLPAQAIAYQCGYADPSHFSHRFTALHGLSPTAYRRRAGTAPSVLEHSGVRRLDRLLRG